MPRLKKGPRILIAIIAFVGLFYGLTKSGVIPAPGFMKSKVIESTTELASNVDPVSASIQGEVAKMPLPSTRLASVSGPEIRFARWFWNAHLPCDFAVGGKAPTQGSLAAQYGVNVNMVWEDMTPKLAEGLSTFATKLSKGDPNPSEGFHYISIMGDQTAGFLGPLNEQLRRLGEEYQAEVIYSCGRSDGEDALMGPEEWKKNPESAIGKTIVTVVTEGDWNIAVKWARDNSLPVNPDVETYDPNAVNFIHAPDNNVAAQIFIANKCEDDRPVVNEGKKTGETGKACPDAASVWTPSDVVVAEERGGVVRIVSTREYSGQMPNVVIGIRKWNQDNRKHVVNMIRAFGEAGDQVLAYEDALRRGAEASAEIYNNSQTPEWILKYYKGTTQRDRQGNLVELGGSRAHNLADNLRWFVKTDMFCATHTVFGNIVHELYPENLKEVPDCKDILNTEYLQEAARLSKPTVAETPEFGGGDLREDAVVSTQKVHINFRTGSAELTPKAERQLKDLYDNLLVASNLAIEIGGHTDNTGTPEGNQTLSEDRAFAVKSWLQNRSKSDFPDRRFSRVRGYGQDNPVERNTTEAGRAANRRVEITLGRQ